MGGPPAHNPGGRWEYRSAQRMDFFRGAAIEVGEVVEGPGQGRSPEPTFYLRRRGGPYYSKGPERVGGPVYIIVGEGGGHVTYRI